MNKDKHIATLNQKINEMLDMGGSCYDHYYRRGIEWARDSAQSEPEETCIMLPCKIGDKVYYTGFDYIIEVEVADYEYWISDGFGFIGHGDFPNTGKLFFSFSQFGKNVFTTRKAAEEALREAGD